MGYIVVNCSIGESEGAAIEDTAAKIVGKFSASDIKTIYSGRRSGFNIDTTS